MRFRSGCPSNEMPNMSKTSRSSQLAVPRSGYAAQGLAVFDLRLDAHALVVMERIQDVQDVELVVPLGIVHRGDVNAVVEKFGVPHAQQDVVNDCAIHHDIFLAEIGAGFANA